MSIENELRDNLRRVAGQLETAEPGPEIQSAGMRILEHRRRRQRTTVLSAGLSAVLIAVAVPVGISVISTDRGAAPAGPAAPSPEAVTAADIYGGPSRGSLSGDAALIEAVRQAPWPEAADYGVPAPPPVESRNVVYVGEFVTGSGPFSTVALVVGAPDVPAPADPSSDTGAEPGDLAAAWVFVPPASSSEEMSVVLPRWISSDLPTSFYDASTGTLIVVAASGDVVEVSDRPEVAADATVTRSYVDPGTVDGIALTTVKPMVYPGAFSVQYRVIRSGDVVAEQGPDERVDLEPLVVPDVDLDYVRAPYYEGLTGGLDQEAKLAGDMLSEFGFAADELPIQAHLVDRLPSLAGTSAMLYVLSITFPSGAELTRATWIETAPVDGPEGGYETRSGICADELTPAGQPSADRFMAMRCDIPTAPRPTIEDGPPGSQASPDPATVSGPFISTLVVIAPLALAGGLVAHPDGAGALPMTLTEEDGVGANPFPEGGQTVQITSIDGTVLDTVPIWTA